MQGEAAKPLRVSLGDRSYPIIFPADGLAGFADSLSRVISPRRVAVVTNRRVARRYWRRVKSGLEKGGYSPIQCLVPDGEPAKTLTVAEEVIGRLIEARLDRDSAIIALGGGVVGDLAGFVAAVFLRGVPYVQVPTTLLAQVDSAVGGKTGVNHRLGKNLIGSFYQPRLVYSDSETLRTLPKRELRAGIAEVIKCGVIRDADLFSRLEKQMPRILAVDAGALVPVIRRACQLKAALVAADELESGVRAMLNFGHTFGHAIEALTKYQKYKHGEAVGIGMIMAGRISARLGLCSADAPARILDLVLAAGLPTKAPHFGRRAWERAVVADKKRRRKEIRFVGVRRIGRCEIVRISVKELLDTLDLEGRSF